MFVSSKNSGLVPCKGIYEFWFNRWEKGYFSSSKRKAHGRQTNPKRRAKERKAERAFKYAEFNGVVAKSDSSMVKVQIYDFHGQFCHGDFLIPMKMYIKYRNRGPVVKAAFFGRYCWIDYSALVYVSE